jgi:hypothetical protein
MSTPAYLKVSKAFRIGRAAEGNYSGVVVASPEAFYFVVGRNVAKVVLAVVRGLLGSAEAIAEMKKKKGLLEPGSELIETDLAELPEEIRGHPDWPVKKDQGRLLIVPRAAVTSLSFPFWKWGIFLRTKTIEFRIEPPLFGRKKLFQSLREMGWEI